MQPYSPERRTALVLCGTGAHGAYHAGVLRALQETGVKIDVVAGQGVGAAGAALAAIDGAARTWDEGGVWRHASSSRLYAWLWPARAVAWLVPALVLTCVAAALSPSVAGPRFVAWLPALTLGLAAAVAASGVLAEMRRQSKRRATGAWWWRVLGSPIDAHASRRMFARAIWQLVRGGNPVPHPSFPAIGTRYSEVLGESLGQPGFKELLIVATDLDARCDLVAGMLQEPYRRQFIAPRTDSDRRAEVLDLAASGREHAFDVVAGALTPPGCEPYQATFGTESHWRGETHRLCSSPGSIARLLEEVAGVGVSQAIVVSGVAPSIGPHRLEVPGLDLRDRLGDFIAASEAAVLRDALEIARLRFDSTYLICPAHNPIGPFDLGGAYDDASDRWQNLRELTELGYEDAYRQFVEPVVGASGDDLVRRTGEGQLPGSAL